MKTLIAACLVLFTAVPSFAEWSSEDTALQATYAVVHIIDWSQTRWISRNPYAYKNGQPRPVSESNLVLGRRPSTDKVDIYFASTLAAHTLISYLLPSEYRTYWQCLTIGFESGVIAKNFNVGIKARF